MSRRQSGAIAKLRRLSRPQKFLLLVLGATSFFDGYDRSILTIALPQVRNTFGLTQSAASLWVAALPRRHPGPRAGATS